MVKFELPPVTAATTTAAVVAVSIFGLLINRHVLDRVNFRKFTMPDLEYESFISEPAPSKSKRTVIITGGNGFLGTNIVRQLLLQGDTNIIVFDIALPRDRNAKVSYVKGNLLKLQHVENAFHLFSSYGIVVDAVIHTASLIPFLGIPKRAIHLVNEQGTQNICDVGKREGLKAFIYTSSATVVLSYHERNARKLREEDCAYPAKNLDTYTASKTAAEKIVLSSGLNVCILRPSAIFGVGDKLVADMLVKDKSGAVLGTGKFKLDYVPVESVAHAHVLAFKKMATAEGIATVNGKAYFIGNDEEHDYGWFNGHETTGSSPELSHWEQPRPTLLPMRAVNFLCGLNDGFFRLSGIILLNASLTFSLIDYTQRSYTYSIERAKQDLGYAPLFTVEEKIGLLVRDYQMRAATIAAANKK